MLDKIEQRVAPVSVLRVGRILTRAREGPG